MFHAYRHDPAKLNFEDGLEPEFIHELLVIVDIRFDARTVISFFQSSNLAASSGPQNRFILNTVCQRHKYPPPCLLLFYLFIFVDIPLISGIARVVEVRLLGVILTSSLSWSCQVDSILVAAYQRLYLLNQLRHMSLDIVGLSNVFRSIVVSKMLYALPAISGSLNQSDIN